MLEIILFSIAFPLFVVVVVIPWLNGVFDFYVGWRFSDNHRADKTAFWLNWNAFKWGWLHNSDKIIEAMPFFKKDLSETFGIRPDDGKVEGDRING